MNKGTLALVAGVTVGTLAAPFVARTLGVQPGEGFGMDDITFIATIVAGVMLAEMVL